MDAIPQRYSGALAARAVKGAIAPSATAYALDCTAFAALFDIISLAGLGFLVFARRDWHRSQKSPASICGAFFSRLSQIGINDL